MAICRDVPPWSRSCGRHIGEVCELHRLVTGNAGYRPRHEVLMAWAMGSVYGPSINSAARPLDQHSTRSESVITGTSSLIGTNRLHSASHLLR